MGSSSSHPIVVSPTSTEKNYVPMTLNKYDDLPTLLSNSTAPSPEVSLFNMKRWEAAFNGDDKSKLASNLISKLDFTTALCDRKVAANNKQFFNTQLSQVTTELPVTNQKSSGRCWLFATTNCIRIPMARKLNLETFEISQSYLFFVDSLSKANYFLESMLDLADLQLEDRLVSFLMTAPENDGGQYTMAANLIQTFGLVPQQIYPESWNSSNTSHLDGLLTSKLREFALINRDVYDKALTTLNDRVGLTTADKKRIATESARKRKDLEMEEIYRILAITLGAPPSPTETWTWEYYSKDKKYHKVTTNALDFYKDYCNFDIKDQISLINDPRNPMDALYTVSRLGNVVGGDPVLYVNAEISVLKQAAIDMIKADLPVFFGCDVGRASEAKVLGVLDPALYDFESAFSTTLGLTKAQRLQTGDSAMTHAMVINAVHLDDVTGLPVRWRIENSWGDAIGTKGFMTMSDAWFDDNVFQVVAPRHKLPAHLLKVFDQGVDKATVLMPWDPMGALA